MLRTHLEASQVNTNRSGLKNVRKRDCWIYFVCLQEGDVGVNIIICEGALSGQCEDIYCKKGWPFWASCCWSLLAQCSSVGQVIPFLRSYRIYLAISQAIFTQINAKVQWNLSPIGVSAYSWVFWINLSFLVLLILWVQS